PARPRDDASVFANPVAMVAMNALLVHQVISATRAMPRPLSVIVRKRGEKSSESDGVAAALTFCQRSGSFMKNRTTNATAAGISPKKNTSRHATSGLDGNATP